MHSSPQALLADTPKTSSGAATQNSGNTLLKARDAAAYLGFTENWLAKMRVFGNGPVYLRMGARQIRYRRADLDEWATANQHRSTSEYQQVA
jgi:predicted DNA-binding transcriptional regulator AlpA